MRKLTEAEERFIEYQIGYASEWRKILTQLIMKSDDENKNKLAKVYPDYVMVVDRYQNEEGYWQKIWELWRIKYPDHPAL